MKITFEGSFEEVIDNCARHFASLGGKFLGPVELGHEMVVSDTDHTTEYKLTSIGKLTVACTCMSFTHRTHDCKHIRRANGRA